MKMRNYNQDELIPVDLMPLLWYSVWTRLGSKRAIKTKVILSDWYYRVWWDGGGKNRFVEYSKTC